MVCLVSLKFARMCDVFVSVHTSRWCMRLSTPEICCVDDLYLNVVLQCVAVCLQCVCSVFAVCLQCVCSVLQCAKGWSLA